MRFLILFAIISLFDVTAGYQRPKRFFRVVNLLTSDNQTGSMTGSETEFILGPIKTINEQFLLGSQWIKKSYWTLQRQYYA